MSIITTRACLFGGALFAAGLAAPEAAGQGLAHWAGSYALITADRISGVDPMFKPYAESPLGVPTTSYTSGGFSGTVTMGTHLLEFAHDRGSSGVFSYSLVGMAADVHPLTDCTIEISWDFGAWAAGVIFVQDVATQVVLWNSAGSSGSDTFPLEHGLAYTIGGLAGGDAAGGPAWARVELAEPCAADIDGNGVINLDDIGAFVDSFLLGCS